jgi:uncharacterized protein YlxW (UPF0749 family)
VRDSDAAETTDGQSTATRVAAALTVGLLALILVVAAQADNAPVASRSGRRVQLVELIRAEQARTRALQDSVEELEAQVAALEQREAGGEQRVARVQRRIDGLIAAAGLTAVRGPGVTSVLTDSRLATTPSGNLNDLVVHEQDLQAVINALWAGGAEAISVNGERILATTAIRCVGNTLLLHGAVYSPPYTISAIGDEAALRAEMDRDPAVQRFREAAREFRLGFSVAADDTLVIPGYDGATGLTVAQTVRKTTR